jgi:hypothetical protein
MKYFSDRKNLLRNLKKCATRSRFTPCLPRVSLLEEERGADENFRKNLPEDFVRKSPWQNN